MGGHMWQSPFTMAGCRALLCLALLPAVAAQALPTYEMRLSTLLLADTDKDLALPRVFLDGVGTHFVSYMDDLPLLETPSGPLFSSIVITSDQGEWGSSQRLNTLRQYAKKYSIRLAFLHVKSSATVSGSGVTVGSQVPATHVAFDSAAVSSDPALADVVNEKGLWELFLPYELAPAPFEIVAGASSSPAPFMRFGTGADGNVDAGVAAVVSSTSHGTEEMYFAFDASFSEVCSVAADCGDDLNHIQYGEDTLLTLSLANVWFTWVTRGVFLGQRRAVFQLHVDDWFSATHLFNEQDPEANFRINADDVNFVVDWQRNVVKTHGLPDGSEFKFEPAFNGANVVSNSKADEEATAAGKSLNKATMDNLGEFNWVSHTWTHQQLDWATDLFCNGKNYKCPLSKDRMDAEVYYNQLLADGKGVKINKTIFPDDVEYEQDTPASALTAIPSERYSRHCLVTPEISGLYPRHYQWDAATWPNWMGPPRPDNVDLFTVFKNRGVECVTGDNSRYELVANTSYHHPVIATSDRYTVTGLTIIPRHTLVIPYDTHNEEKYLENYNLASSMKCYGTPGPACVAGVQSTYDEAMDRQAYNALYFLLQYRQDPYMFHQANLHAFARASTGQTTTHLTFFADKTFAKYVGYVNKMPVTSPKMEDTCESFRSRLYRDTCNPSAFVTVANGLWQDVRVQGDDGCSQATALLTVRRCNHHALAGVPATYYGLDAVFQIPLSHQSSPAYALKASGDNIACRTGDAPPIPYPVTPTSSTKPASTASRAINIDTDTDTGTHAATATATSTGTGSSSTVDNIGPDPSNRSAASRGPGPSVGVLWCAVVLVALATRQWA